MRLLSLLVGALFSISGVGADRTQRFCDFEFTYPDDWSLKVTESYEKNCPNAIHLTNASSTITLEIWPADGDWKTAALKDAELICSSHPSKLRYCDLKSAKITDLKISGRTGLKIHWPVVERDESGKKVKAGERVLFLVPVFANDKKALSLIVKQDAKSPHLPAVEKMIRGMRF